MPRKRALKPEVADGIREVRLGAHRVAGDDVTKARNNRNRRIRNRSYGGVGGRGPRGPLLPDLVETALPTPHAESAPILRVFLCCRSGYSFLRRIFNNSKVFLFAAFGDCLEAFAASSNVLSVMFLGSPMSSPGFPHPQL